METCRTTKSRLRAKLIFNPGSGAAGESPAQLIQVAKELQELRILPELYLICPGCDLAGMVQKAVGDGISLFIASGGDGTVSSVARALCGLDATLGILPTGTQNNIAHSLGIPQQIPEAAALLRNGRRCRVDIGLATCGKVTLPFFEVCSMGLFTSIFPSADDIQHGNLTRVGDFLQVAVSAPPSDIHLRLNDRREIRKPGHILLISNMPYVLRHYQVGSVAAYKDGLLDIVFFAGLSKLELMEVVMSSGRLDAVDDPRVQHYRVRSAEIEASPAMPVMADGIPMGSGSVRVEAQKGGIHVLTPRPASTPRPKAGGAIEK